MMDFEIIQNTLKDIFNDPWCWYFGKNIQTKYLEFHIKTKSITPEINSKWTKEFPSGSYFSISKSSNEKDLTLVVSISDRDYDNYFMNRPEIKINDLGIMEGLRN